MCIATCLLGIHTWTNMIFELSEYAIHSALHVPAIAKMVPWHLRHHHRYARNHDYEGEHWQKSVAQQMLALGLCSFTWSYGCTPLLLYVSWSVLVYNTMHCISHTDFWPVVRAYHRAHHRDPRKNRGVSSPACDWLFGSIHKDFTVTTPLLLILPPPMAFAAIRETPSNFREKRH